MTYDIKLDTLLDDFENLTNSSAVWDSFFEYVKTLGIEAMSYYHLPPPGALDFDEKVFIARGFNASDVAEYRRHHTMFIDPLEDRSRPLKAPIFWSKICSVMNFSVAQKAYLKELYFKTHLNGLVIPVHGTNSRNGCIVLRFKEAYRRYNKYESRKLQWASQYAHLTFCKLHAKPRDKHTALTSREQEILTWVARGKSNSVIADIIGISQHTVNGYLRRIYLKTGTSDRTTASLRGIGESLISY